MNSKQHCNRCGKQVYPTDKVGPLKDSTFFHQGCFKCYICGTRLALKTYCNNRNDINDKELASNSAPDLPSSRPSSTDHSSSTPTILVSPATSDYSNGGFFGGDSNGNVKDRARKLENMGFVPRVSNGGGGPIERPISQVSTLSQVSDDFDDGDTSASDEESTSTTTTNHLQRHRHEDDFDELPLPRNDRKTTAVAVTHSEIMHEMEHLFVRYHFFFAKEILFSMNA
uniref:LIM zinc-binding domain-containing protein n=1 Tax=Caenorhabditis tropicalis TaxID=1561998 RepID=A0A1I7TNV7_9PELO